jgi:hypothetical protein
MRGKVVGLVAAVALFASVGIANAKSPRREPAPITVSRIDPRSIATSGAF